MLEERCSCTGRFAGWCRGVGCLGLGLGWRFALSSSSFGVGNDGSLCCGVDDGGDCLSGLAGLFAPLEVVAGLARKAVGH